jgi:predicted nuclease of predicted toxin-antitoxin system
VSGLGIKIYTDEMVSARLAAALRQRGYDVEGCHEGGRANRHISDPEQLAYATEQGRAILTQNATDFYALDFAWKATERRHAGILVYSAHLRFADLLARLPRLLDTTSPESQENTLLWLP